LPGGFRPASQDGESVEHRLCEFDEVLALAAEPDAMTLDATLVALDHLLRRGWLVPDQPGYLDVAGARCAGAWARTMDRRSAFGKHRLRRT
jgi:hypothetical protein